MGGPVNVDSIRNRFERAVDVSAGSDACHPWTRARDRDGYGAMKIAGKMHRSNRVTFFLKHGHWPVIARHTCDNPPCCNGEHIVDGTTLDNQRDRRRNGTAPVNAQNPNAKLTEDDVRAIRASAEPGKTLAARYGVQDACISKIRKRRTWRSV